MIDPAIKNCSRFTAIADRYLDPASVRVVLDVGSRDAEVALRLKEHYENARVYAFECNPVAIELCRKNIAGRPGIVLVEKAVADVTGTLDFYAIEDGNIGASSLYLFNPEIPQLELTQRRISVPSTTLRDWAGDAGVDRIDIIWIDLQGAELLALKSLGKLLGSVQCIHTEVEYKRIYAGQPLEHEVRAYLTANGLAMLTRFYEFNELFGDELYIRRNLLPLHLRIVRSEPVQHLATTLKWAEFRRDLGLARTIWMLRAHKVVPTLRRMVARLRGRQ